MSERRATKRCGGMCVTLFVGIFILSLGGVFLIVAQRTPDNKNNDAEKSTSSGESITHDVTWATDDKAYAPSPTATTIAIPATADTDTWLFTGKHYDIRVVSCLLFFLGVFILLWGTVANGRCRAFCCCCCRSTASDDPENRDEIGVRSRKNSVDYNPPGYVDALKYKRPSQFEGTIHISVLSELSAIDLHRKSERNIDVHRSNNGRRSSRVSQENSDLPSYATALEMLEKEDQNYGTEDNASVSTQYLITCGRSTAKNA